MKFKDLIIRLANIETSIDSKVEREDVEDLLNNAIYYDVVNKLKSKEEVSDNISNNK